MLQGFTDNQAIIAQTESIFPEVMMAIMVVAIAIYLHRKEFKAHK